MENGKGYIILTGCTLMYMLIIGEVKSYGILYTEMLSYYGSGAGDTGWIGGISFFLAAALGPVAISLCNTFSFRKVTFVGGLLVGIGHIACSFVPKIGYLYATFGIIVGTGFGAILLPSTTLPSFYFEKRRYLANGVLLASSGIWAIALPFIYEVLLETYSLKATFLVVGAVQLNICLGACLLIDGQQDPSNIDNCLAEYRDTSLSSWRRFLKEVGGYLCMFKRASFCSYLASVILIMLVDIQNNILITAPLQTMGYSKTDEAINIALMSGSDIVARFFFGWFSDQNVVTAKTILIVNTSSCSIISFLATTFTSLIYTRIYSLVLGALITSYPVLLPPLFIEAFGLEQFPIALSVTFTCGSFANLLGQPISGWTKDGTGNWNTAFLFVGSVLALAALNLLLGPWTIRLLTHEKNDSHGENHEVVQSTRL